jgi:hypothetical protein
LGILGRNDDLTESIPKEKGARPMTEQDWEMDWEGTPTPPFNEEWQLADDNPVLDIRPIGVSEPMAVIPQAELATLRAELAALRARVAEQDARWVRANDVLRRAEMAMTSGDGDHIWCFVDDCEAFGHDGDTLHHDHGCVGIEIQALLGEGGQNK